MDATRLAAHAAIQTLYTLHGLDNPLILPAMQRQVEHRSEGLSRRGFLGLVGAGGAGLMAGAIFDPEVKLWTPTGDAPLVELAPEGIFRVDAALQELARLFALAFDERGAVHPFLPSGWHGRGRGQTAREDLGDGWMMSHARAIMHTGPEDCAPWIATEDGKRRIGRLARRAVEVPAFNEQHPLALSAVETDPTVRVADYLAPKTGALARVIQYDQPSGWKGCIETWTDFEIAGAYRPGRKRNT